jgi:hypothetical protein
LHNAKSVVGQRENWQSEPGFHNHTLLRLNVRALVKHDAAQRQQLMWLQLLRTH